MKSNSTADEQSFDKKGVVTLAKQGSITFLGNTTGKILNFIFLIAVTRLVDPSIFGIYSLGLAIVLFVKAISDISIHRSIDYFVPQYLEDETYGKARYVVGSATGIALLGTGSAMIIVWMSTSVLADFFGEPDLTTVLPILVLALPFLAFRDISIRLFIAIKQLKYRVYLQNIIFPILKLLLTVGLLVAGFELIALLAGYVVAVIAIAIIAGVFLLRYIPWLLKSSTERVSTRNLLSYSLPLVFAGVIYATIAQIDFFVIGYASATNSEDLAVYKIAVLFGSNLLIFLSSLAPVFKPMITEARNDSSLLNSRYTLAARWILLFTLPVAITIILSPESYLSLLFTPRYATGGTALIILIIGYLINSAVGPEGMVLEGLGYTRLTLLNTILMLGTNTLLDLILVPRIGISGAAIGTTAGITVAVVAGVIEIKYFAGAFPFNIQTLRVLISSIPSLVIGGITVSMLSSRIIIAVLLPFLVTGIYLISLISVDAFSSDDRIVADLMDDRLGFKVLGRIISK